MTGNRLLNYLVNHPGNPLLKLGGRLLYSDIARPAVLRLIRRRVEAVMQLEKNPPGQRKIKLQRKLIIEAALHSVEQAAARRTISRQVLQRVAGLWLRVIGDSVEEHPGIKRFKEQYRRDPPWFIVFSPGRACNLKCEGCYADSGIENIRLPWSLLDRAISDAKASWGIKLIVFSGGEPLAYRSEGKDILDIVEAHPELLFLMFTNGTLLDERMAQRMARLKNLTPAFSVEGMRPRTDKRRGEGIFDAVVAAMERVRRAGVPLGISVTVNRSNIEEVLSDEFLDFFFKEQGAFYGFFFQYLPIGRRPDFENMPGPDQRVAFWRKIWEIVEKKHLFLVDFWNHGPLAKGCMAAGRGGGYLHIDWNGKVTPCVFVPYAAGNIREIYQQGGSLSDIWASPFLAAIRDWQDAYGFSAPEPAKEADWLRACPFRDHNSQFKKWVDIYRPDPQDEAAGDVLQDPEYTRQLYEYELELAERFDRIWKEEFLPDR